MVRRPKSLSHQLWLSIFTANVVMLLLLGWAFSYLEPGTASYAIAQVSAVIVGISIVGTLIALFSDWTPF